MRRDDLRPILMSIALGSLVFLTAGCAALQKEFVDPFTANSKPKSVEPAFEWDSGLASSGASLAIEEAERVLSPGATLLQYRLSATGFPEEEPLDLWWKRGTTYQKLPATVSEGGTVLVGGMDILAVAGLVRGQAVDLALASGETRAHAKIIPFPIESKSGDCWASAELVSESGLLFLITLGGFEPAEQVEVTSDFKTESHTDTMEASDAGELAFPVLFGKGDNGMAAAYAKGSSGTISIQYEVGEDALKPQ